MKGELIFTDGYKIDRTIYPSIEAAKEEMRKSYNERNNNTSGDEWDEVSYLREEEAILYAAGENVYCWAVYEI